MGIVIVVQLLETSSFGQPKLKGILDYWLCPNSVICSFLSQAKLYLAYGFAFVKTQ